VLAIAAGRMHRDGRTFFRSENGVWLTDAVPAEYIESGIDPSIQG
jgi:putative RNA 2'-phosphotransferase